MNDVPDLSQLLSAGPDGIQPGLLKAIGRPILSRAKTRIPYEMKDEDLTQAAMTALLLGQPLILAGNPGVGKTQFAIALSAKLDLLFLPPHQVKSSDEGRDLLYSFDQVGHYRAKEESPLSKHVHFTALGLGILLSAGPDAEVKLGTIPLHKIVDDEVADRIAARDGTILSRDLFPNAFPADTPAHQRSIVLLDELDKAPRDAPNDILGEIEQMRFRMTELDIEIAAHPDNWPVVMITTNSEQSLPDAFLRRCIFHWIADPDKERLIRIVALHLMHHYDMEVAEDAPFLTTAADVFTTISKERLNKRPATAEFVSFIFNLWERGLRENDRVDLDSPHVRASSGTLLKTQTDRHKYFPDPDGR